MDDTRTLDTLLDHATRARDDAQATQQRLQEAAARQAAQVQLLQGYRAEYQQRWQQQFRGDGGGIQIVHCYRDFMTRIEQALAAQQAQADAAAARAEAARHALVEAERRVAAIGKLLERRRADAARTHARREQRASDEHAARQARARAVQAASQFGGLF